MRVLARRRRCGARAVAPFSDSPERRKGGVTSERRGFTAAHFFLRSMGDPARAVDENERESRLSCAVRSSRHDETHGSGPD
jgi:hypothetical protein